MSTRLLCACPNLALERLQRLARLTVGEVLRARESHAYAGGKGVNVARATRRLGGEATVVSFAGGRLGPVALAMAADEGVEIEAVTVDGELRAVNVILTDDGSVTMVTEMGAAVTAADWERYVTAVDAHLGDVAALVCSGSAPPGTPADAYAQLVTAARRRGVLAVVDATGAALRAALAAGPDLVSPNLHEARAALDGLEGEQVEVTGDAVTETALGLAQRLCGAGARRALVSAGGHGVAAASSAADAAWIPAPTVDLLCPIGAGDVLVAATVLGLCRGLSLRSAVSDAVPYAAASVETLLPADFELSRADSLRSIA